MHESVSPVKPLAYYLDEINQPSSSLGKIRERLIRELKEVNEALKEILSVSGDCHDPDFIDYVNSMFSKIHSDESPYWHDNDTIGEKGLVIFEDVNTNNAIVLVYHPNTGFKIGVFILLHESSKQGVKKMRRIMEFNQIILFELGPLGSEHYLKSVIVGIGQNVGASCKSKPILQ